VTVFDKSARKDGTFSRDDFTYDHEHDVYHYRNYGCAVLAVACPKFYIRNVSSNIRGCTRPGPLGH
jgi:hypothetical protein